MTVPAALAPPSRASFALHPHGNHGTGVMNAGDGRLGVGSTIISTEDYSDTTAALVEPRGPLLLRAVFRV